MKDIIDLSIKRNIKKYGNGIYSISYSWGYYGAGDGYKYSYGDGYGFMNGSGCGQGYGYRYDDLNRYFDKIGNGRG